MQNLRGKVKDYVKQAGLTVEGHGALIELGVMDGILVDVILT